MRLEQLIEAIEKVAPLPLAASWDKSGVQVACRRDEVNRVALALDPTPATIRKALELGCDYLVTHHPLSLSPSLPNRLDHWHEALSLLFRADMGHYACHTSLDVQPDGPVGWLARHLGLRHPQILEPVAENAGYGLAGDLPAPLSLAQLVEKMAERVDMSMAVVAGPVPEIVRRVAYCTGSGSSLLKEAEASGCDVYITGDVKHHTALDTLVGILDVGHHSLEEEMMREMRDLLDARLDIEAIFVASPSPFRKASS